MQMNVEFAALADVETVPYAVLQAHMHTNLELAAHTYRETASYAVR